MGEAMEVDDERRGDGDEADCDGDCCDRDEARSNEDRGVRRDVDVVFGTSDLASPNDIPGVMPHVIASSEQVVTERDRCDSANKISGWSLSSGCSDRRR